MKTHDTRNHRSSPRGVDGSSAQLERAMGAPS